MARPKGLCKECYPDGWDAVPAEYSGVGCEHGSWTRPGVGELTTDDGTSEGNKQPEEAK
jgi:hypothetical protein